MTINFDSGIDTEKMCLKLHVYPDLSVKSVLPLEIRGYTCSLHFVRVSSLYDHHYTHTCSYT